MKLVLKILGGIVVLLVMAVSTIYVFATQKLNRPIEYTDSSPPIPKDSAAIERGRHIATTISKCVDCHGRDFGGQVLADVPPFRLVAPNITGGRGGVLAARSDDDLLRAVRHGIGVGGRPLVMMPARSYWPMGDEDASALVAYLRTVPAVDREVPSTKFSLLGRFLLLQGEFDALFEAHEIDHMARREPPPPADSTAAYGKYLASIGGCTGCHGVDLSGGPIPGGPPDAPPAANLTPSGIGSWTQENFFTALRQGVRPDGTPIDTTMMPVPMTRQMTDLETKAIYEYLKTVPAKATAGM
jgi:mono/diheme cytochrome c family protein